MKKTAVVAAIVVLGAAAWMGTAWYTGQRVEQAVRLVSRLSDRVSIS